MCGICGIYNKDNQPVDPAVLRKMNDAMMHRGPDDWGMEVAENIGLAMRRLSIIDLAGGHQPIHNEDKSIWVVLNGEIYNYGDLRKKLEALGHTFYTHSDTESIVHLYEEYGDDFVTHLRGMFGIAIWDKRRQRVVIARDRAGIKPIFYYQDDRRLLFGSEMKVLLQHPAVSREIDYSALDAYFTNCFIPAPKTVFKNIHKLLPGHLLIVEKERVFTQKYWELDYQIDEQMTFTESLSEFRRQFTEAVKLRMIAEVPLGAFLSGGIDSSAVVATMSELSDRPVKTFSIGFEGEVGAFDETKDARKVAQMFGADHQEFVVKPNVREIAQWMAEFYDEPFSNSSSIPNYYVCKVAREHVTVALSGLGGDEIAVGYPRHMGILMAQYYRQLPKILREKVLPAAVNVLPDSGNGGRIAERMKRFVKSGIGDMYSNYMGYMTYLDVVEKQRLYSPDFMANVNGFTSNAFRQYFDKYDDAHLVNRAAFTDLNIDLPENLLALTDRMSMAVSLEVRVPFLDHELLKFMSSVPVAYKLKGLNTKTFLKKAFEGTLPNDVLYKKKQGFSIPLALWFRRELKDFVLEILSKERVERTGVLQYPAVQAMLNEHFSVKENHYRTIWSMIVFVLWHEANFSHSLA